MFYFQKKFIIFNPLEQFEISTVWFSHQKSINFIKRLLFKLNNFFISSSFLTDHEQLTLVKELVVEIKVRHLNELTLLFEFIDKKNNPSFLLLLWPSWLFIYFIFNLPFTKTQFIGITLINSQVYNYFSVFPNSLINKAVIRNKINMEYDVILTEIDVILNTKISGNEVISLDFLDKLWIINYERVDFIEAVLKSLNSKRSIFFNPNFRDLYNMDDQLVDKINELGDLVNLITTLV